VSQTGKPMKRETDLIDVWFDSGAMPYAQIHYPFENRGLLDKGEVYPADFIAEGVDQTRGWFFTLHAIAAMAFDAISFKAVVSNGLVLDKFGNKMSKRLGNAVDPFTTIEQYGSDPLRWYMITNASPWDNLKFNAEGIEEVQRKFFGTLYNTYSFFALYANVDGFEYKEADIPVSERPEIDRWILSVLHSLIKETDACYNDYEPTKAGRLISDFVNDNLSNWYVRLNRKRFWGGGYSQDKISAYQTLYTCLETVARLMAPIAPFYADRLYMDLITVTKRDNVISVHLAKYPAYNAGMVDTELETRMQMAQDITSMVLALRRKVNIKVRQPLQHIMIPVINNEQRTCIEAVKSLITNEVNVKEINFVEGGGTAGILVKKVKCDFRKLGPKFGKQMKAVAKAVEEMSQETITEFEKEGKYAFNLDGATVVVETTDVEIINEDIPGWLVANEGKLTVALEVTITEALRHEGIARELINRIQNIRKSSGFEITDKIKILLSKNPQTDAAVNEYHTYICNQVLGNSLVLADKVEKGIELDFEDFSLFIDVARD
jgi:isoleucyl-tRNA synthetase